VRGGRLLGRSFGAGADFPRSAAIIARTRTATPHSSAECLIARLALDGCASDVRFRTLPHVKDWTVQREARRLRLPGDHRF
jgi:hypothetical protein